LGMNL